ncbi:MAG: hypothetical protein R6U17_06755 [Thermoplasmata archaeon]
MANSKPSDDPDSCEHDSRGNDWLPILKNREKDVLALHPYCERCGLVRNIGPDRAKKFGYYVEVLSEIERFLKHESKKGGRCKLTESQKRLVVKKMEEDEVFNDLYGTPSSAQEDRFVEILLECRSDLKRCEIEYYLEGRI